MVKRIYAVKATAFGDPFASFDRIESAAEVAVRISPDNPESLIVTIPVFKDCDVIESEEEEGDWFMGVEVNG